jgi:hypothetical protein
MTGRAKLVPGQQASGEYKLCRRGLKQQRTKQAGRASASEDGVRAPDTRYVLSSFILRIALDRTETKLLDELAA